MVAGDLSRGSRKCRGSAVTRAELELAIRAELVDFGATGWHARVTAGYILGVVDDYLQARGECLGRHLEEILHSHLGAESAGEVGGNADLARWILEDYQRAIRQDLAREGAETSRGTGSRQRSSVEGD